MVSGSADGLEPTYAWFGSAAQQTQQLTLFRGRFVGEVDLQFTRPGARVSGVVTDASGAPVAAANVQAMATFTRTDVDGEFDLWLEPRQASILVSAPGYAEVSQELTMSGSVVDVTLEAEAVLRGRVVDEASGVPVANAAIMLHRGALDDPLTVSASDGSFEIRGLGGGSYQPLALTAGRYGMLPAPITLVSGSAAPPVTIATTRAHTITGRIQTRDGGACEDGQVVVSSGWQWRLFTVVAAPDGTLSFTLPTGSYVFTARCSGYGVDSGDEQLIDHAQSLEWMVARDLAIVGRLVDRAGAPLVHTKMWASPLGRWHDVDPVWTGPNGEFVIVGVGAASSYWLHANHPSFVPTEVSLSDEDLDLGSLRLAK